MISKSIMVDTPTFNKERYEDHFDKLIAKIKKKKIKIIEPVELLYLQNDLKIPVSILSESLDCSNGIVCGYVNKNMPVQPAKQRKLKHLIDFAIGVLEQKVQRCNNITKIEQDILYELIEKGRCILYGKQYKSAKVSHTKRQPNVFIGGGH